MLVKGDNACAYCDAANDGFHWEHIIPKSRGGPDTIDNMVLACPDCNLSKGAKDPFEWYGNKRKYEIPRLVLGKYLKLVFEAHQAGGTLDSVDLNEDIINAHLGFRNILQRESRSILRFENGLHRLSLLESRVRLTLIMP